MKLQKRAERLVDGAGKYDHTAPIFEKYELLNLKNLYIYCAQIFLYKHHQKVIPETFLICLKLTMLSTIITQGKKSIFMCLFANLLRSHDVWDVLV